jgi:hypothetical protein
MSSRGDHSVWYPFFPIRTFLGIDREIGMSRIQGVRVLDLNC